MTIIIDLLLLENSTIWGTIGFYSSLYKIYSITLKGLAFPCPHLRKNSQPGPGLDLGL
jgi:hypothetical protein